MKLPDNDIFEEKHILDMFPSLRSSKLDYLVRNRIIPVVQRGKGIPRIYKKDSLQAIHNWLKKRSNTE